MRNTPEKRPRQHAAEIIALPTREQRAAALDLVPDAVREAVRHLVQDHFIRQHYRDHAA